MAIGREVWRAAQVELDVTRLAFVDETGTTTSMTRLRGWGRPGKPLVGKAPHGHWLTQTFVAALRHDGIAAPMLLNTPMTGRIFQQWLTDHLIPELPPGSIVVCDNLPAHKVAGVRECLEAAGMSLLYLPPYSPDLNPIEQVFAQGEGAAATRRTALVRCDHCSPAIHTHPLPPCRMRQLPQTLRLCAKLIEADSRAIPPEHEPAT